MRISFSTIAIAILASSPACSKNHEDHSSSEETKTPPQKTYTCAKDNDCVATCTIAGNCCGQGCACTNVYHRDQLNAIKQANDAKCGTKDKPKGGSWNCPAYKCPKSKWKIRARCRSRICTGVKIPKGSRMKNGFFTMADTPPPLSCKTAADCVGSTLRDETGCCPNHHPVAPHSKSYASWWSKWRTSNCTDVECPKPPYRGEPLNCYWNIKCVKGSCANTCSAGK